jgi:hypothetical protein
MFIYHVQLDSVVPVLDFGTKRKGENMRSIHIASVKHGDEDNKRVRFQVTALFLICFEITITHSR